MTTYTYTIYDCDPISIGGGDWPSHTNIEIEAEDISDLEDKLGDILEIEAVGLSESDGYSVGDEIHVLAWDDKGMIACHVKHRLTEEDLA